MIPSPIIGSNAVYNFVDVNVNAIDNGNRRSSDKKPGNLAISCALDLASAKLVYHELFSGEFPSPDDVTEAVLEYKSMQLTSIDKLMSRIFLRESVTIDENVFCAIIAASCGRAESLV